MFPVGIIVAILMHFVLLLIYIRQSCELSSSMLHTYASSKNIKKLQFYPNHRIMTCIRNTSTNPDTITEQINLTAIHTTIVTKLIARQRTTKTSCTLAQLGTNNSIFLKSYLREPIHCTYRPRCKTETQTTHHLFNYTYIHTRFQNC